MFGAPAVPAVPPLVDASPVQFKRNMDFFITHLGEEPLQMYCPTCRTNVLTNIDYKFGGLACLISLFCLPCLCCCCIPCITSSKIHLVFYK